MENIGQKFVEISNIVRKIKLHSYRGPEDKCAYDPMKPMKGQFFEVYDEVVDADGITVSNESICEALAAIAEIQHICDCSSTKLPDPDAFS